MLLLFCSPATDDDDPRPTEALLTRRIALELCFRSRSCPVVKLELRSFFELDLLRFPVEAEAPDWNRESESRFLTRVVSESRFAFGSGELLTSAVATGLTTVGDDPAPFETGIEELRLFSSDVSRRQLCAESGRFRLTSFWRSLLVIELGPVDFMFRLPVLLFSDLFVSDPDGDGELFSPRCEARKFLPVGGFGAAYPLVPASGILLGLLLGVSGHCNLPSRSA